MKKLIAISALWLVAVFAHGQDTATLTGTVVDSDTLAWKGAGVTFSIVNPSGGPLVNSCTGGIVPNHVVTTLNSSGTFIAGVVLTKNSCIVPAGTRWQVTIQPLASTPQQILPQQTINADLDEGVYISANITAPRFVDPYVVNGYGTIEVSSATIGAFFYTNIGGPCKQWSGTTWNPCGSVTPPVTACSGYYAIWTGASSLGCGTIDYNVTFPGEQQLFLTTPLADTASGIDIVPSGTTGVFIDSKADDFITGTKNGPINAVAGTNLSLSAESGITISNAAGVSAPNNTNIIIRNFDTGASSATSIQNDGQGGLSINQFNSAGTLAVAGNGPLSLSGGEGFSIANYGATGGLTLTNNATCPLCSISIDDQSGNGTYVRSTGNTHIVGVEVANDAASFYSVNISGVPKLDYGGTLTQSWTMNTGTGGSINLNTDAGDVTKLKGNGSQICTLAAGCASTPLTCVGLNCYEVSNGKITEYVQVGDPTTCTAGTSGAPCINDNTPTTATLPLTIPTKIIAIQCNDNGPRVAAGNDQPVGVTWGAGPSITTFQVNSPATGVTTICTVTGQ